MVSVPDSLSRGAAMPPTAAAKRSHPDRSALTQFLPAALQSLDDPQKDIPRIAKDKSLTAEIERALPHIPTSHDLYRRDAREMCVPPASVHLVLTSPPYWTLKEYNRTEGQLGNVASYDRFLAELDKVWAKAFDALVPGGRLICV